MGTDPLARGVLIVGRRSVRRGNRTVVADIARTTFGGIKEIRIDGRLYKTPRVLGNVSDVVDAAGRARAGSERPPPQPA
jgi:hypothetical protein